MLFLCLPLQFPGYCTVSPPNKKIMSLKKAEEKLSRIISGPVSSLTPTASQHFEDMFSLDQSIKALEKAIFCSRSWISFKNTQKTSQLILKGKKLPRPQKKKTTPFFLCKTQTAHSLPTPKKTNAATLCPRHCSSFFSSCAKPAFSKASWRP